MNANYGLLPPLKTRERGHQKRLRLADRAEVDFQRWAIEQHIETVPLTILRQAAEHIA
jgi:folate-dependent tRNA-U54 methylase TrmFO/GidA